MRAIASTLAALMLMAVHAQLEIPVPITLSGAQTNDRQVTGLAAPTEATSAVSVDGARDHAVSFTTVTGDSILTGTLTPVPATYTAGMLVTIVLVTSNADEAMLDLNGLGPQAVVKQGGLPLDSADLIVGSPVRLLYDGSQFRVIGSTYLPCAAGYHIGGREFCIEDSARGDINFFMANSSCIDRGARLCSFSEWNHACRSNPSFIGTVLDYEWVDNAANNGSDAKVVGKGPDATGTAVIGCEYGRTSAPTNTYQHRYRCCTHR